MKNFKKLFGFTRLVKPLFGFTRLVKPLFGFTLAEVLITLSILGVVAAITVPSLIKRNEEKSTVAKVLKMVSALSEATDRAIAENGEPQGWVAKHGTKFGALLDYLPVEKFCYDGDTCSDTNTFKNFHGTTFTDWKSAAILKDGTRIRYYVWTSNCDQKSNYSPTLNNVIWFDGGCGHIIFDINGDKKPNEYGKDIFLVYLTRKGIENVPLPNKLCTKTNADSWSGQSCVSHIIKYRNLDYLRE